MKLLGKGILLVAEHQVPHVLRGELHNGGRACTLLGGDHERTVEKKVLVGDSILVYLTLGDGGLNDRLDNGGEDDISYLVW